MANDITIKVKNVDIIILTKKLEGLEWDFIEAE